LERLERFGTDLSFWLADPVEFSLSCDLWVGYLEIFKYLPNEMFINLTVPWDGGNFSCFTIHINAMVAALPQEFGTVPFEVADQIDPLH
jgi:hypothetical protein